MFSVYIAHSVWPGKGVIVGSSHWVGKKYATVGREMGDVVYLSKPKGTFAVNIK